MATQLILPLNVNEKNCSNCKQSHSLTNFYYIKTRGRYTSQCKPCLRQKSNAAYHRKSPEQKQLEWKKQKARLESNPVLQESRRLSGRRWAAKMRKDSARNAEWNRYRRAKYAEDPESDNSRGKAYRKTKKGRDAVARGNHNRREKLRVSGRMTIGISDLVKRQNGRCFYCPKRFNRSRRPTIDHIIPLKLGGTNDESNLVAACLSCNSSKKAKHPHAYASEIGRLLI